jgi:outer membrane protein assembly factor BamA
VSLGSKFTVSQKSFFGPRVTAQFARHDILGRAETAAIGVLLSRLDQRATFSYGDPDFLGSRWSSLFSLTAERTTENPIFTAAIAQASIQVETNLDKRKTQKIVTRYSYRRTDLSNLLISDLVLPQDQRVKLSSVSAEYIRDTRDKPLDAHQGQFESLSVAVNPTIFGSSANFVKFLAQASFYKPIRPRLTWANNFRVGVAPPFAGSIVPLSERFFSGGASTLRGFAINGAGPQRPVQVCSNPADTSTCTLISVPVGGEMLAIFNSEVRFPIPLKKDLGGVVFYDGGNVYNNINLRQLVNNYTNTVGAGIRYNTKVGPVRFDIARRLTVIPGVKATQYFITLGQAF